MSAAAVTIPSMIAPRNSYDKGRFDQKLKTLRALAESIVQTGYEPAQGHIIEAVLGSVCEVHLRRILDREQRPEESEETYHAARQAELAEKLAELRAEFDVYVDAVELLEDVDADPDAHRDIEPGLACPDRAEELYRIAARDVERQEHWLLYAS